MNQTTIVEQRMVDLGQIANMYCSENGIVLIEGDGFNNGLDVAYRKIDGSEELELTKLHSADLSDYESAMASRRCDELLTMINYVALTSKRLFDKFKEVPSDVKGSYGHFLRDMNRVAKEIKEKGLQNEGVSLRHGTMASQADLKRILDYLIRA